MRSVGGLGFGFGEGYSQQPGHNDSYRNDYQSCGKLFHRGKKRYACTQRGQDPG